MITVDYKKPYFKLTFPYNDRDLKTVRDLPIREWKKVEKEWVVPELAVKSIDELQAIWTDIALINKERITRGLLSLVDYKFIDWDKSGQKGKLRSYQLIGASFIVRAKKVLLADDMGLGKTIQAIQALISLGTEKNLILCPAT